MTTKPHKGDRLEALLKRLPPLKDNPDFAAAVISTLRRGHLIRAGIIGGSVLAGLAVMLVLVPFDVIGEFLSLFGTWSDSIDFTAPKISFENGIAIGVVVVLFLVSLMATQDA